MKHNSTREHTNIPKYTCTYIRTCNIHVCTHVHKNTHTPLYIHPYTQFLPYNWSLWEVVLPLNWQEYIPSEILPPGWMLRAVIESSACSVPIGGIRSVMLPPGGLDVQETVTLSPTRGQESTSVGTGLSLPQLFRLTSCPFLSVMVMVRMGPGPALP